MMLHQVDHWQFKYVLPEAHGDLKPFGLYICCSFEGSLVNRKGTGGWVVHAGLTTNGLRRVPSGTAPIFGAESSTACEGVAVSALMRLLELWIVRGLCLQSACSRAPQETPFLNSLLNA